MGLTTELAFGNQSVVFPEACASRCPEVERMLETPGTSTNRARDLGERACSGLCRGPIISKTKRFAFVTCGVTGEEYEVSLIKQED